MTDEGPGGHSRRPGVLLTWQRSKHKEKYKRLKVKEVSHSTLLVGSNNTQSTLVLSNWCELLFEESWLVEVDGSCDSVSTKGIVQTLLVTRLRLFPKPI